MIGSGVEPTVCLFWPLVACSDHAAFRYASVTSGVTVAWERMSTFF
jgi:hypothetical protein